MDNGDDSVDRVLNKERLTHIIKKVNKRNNLHKN